MKKRLFHALALVCVAAASTRAQVISQNFNGLNSTIPDGSLSGLANSQTLSGANGFVTDIEVSLSISGTGFGAVNGDLYVYLAHAGSISVLLNRPGRRADSSLGYDDSGLNNVTFSAGGSDVHNYRLALSNDHTTALGTALTGTWAPDGRNVSPLNALDTTPRTAGLDGFNGLAAGGAWTLFIADLQSGGTARLDSWGLSVTTTPVPEPGQTAVIAGAALLVFAIWRRGYCS